MPINTMRIQSKHFTDLYGQRSRGVALITAILITSMVSIAAVAMVTQQQLDIRRTQNILHYDQAYVYVVGAEEFARNTISEDSSKKYDFYPISEQNFDIIGVPFAEDIKKSGMDIGGISGIITDASASFPLNMLVNDDGTKNQDYADVFSYLIENNLEFNHEFDNLVLDWIDKDDNVTSGGAEDMDYLNLTTPNRPYRTPNQPISSVSELRLMLALSEDAQNARNDYAALARPAFDPLNAVSLDAIEQQPLVNAIPRTPNSPSKININTAPKTVLKALVDYIVLAPNVAEEIVNEFDEMRKEQPQEKTDQFMKLIDDKVDETQPNSPGSNTAQRQQDPAWQEYEAKKGRVQTLQNMIDVKSEYFYLTARSQIGEVEVSLISLLHRKDNKVVAVRRGIGVI